jgi:hypothetical protein
VLVIGFVAAAPASVSEDEFRTLAEKCLGTQERVPKKSRTILSRDLALRKRRCAPQKVVYAHGSTKK